jgi:hypothetical protein
MLTLQLESPDCSSFIRAGIHQKDIKPHICHTSVELDFGCWTAQRCCGCVCVYIGDYGDRGGLLTVVVVVVLAMGFGG